jgi:hypothetical protein
LKLESKLRLYLANGGGATAIIAGFDEQHQRVIVEVKIGIQAPGDHVVGYAIKLLPGGDGTMETEVLGDTTIAGELAGGRTERSRSWRSAISLRSTGLGLKDQLLFEAQYVAESTAQYDPDLVGGPIDLIVVTRKLGVMWVRRKSACRIDSPAEKSVGSQR